MIKWRNLVWSSMRWGCLMRIGSILSICNWGRVLKVYMFLLMWIVLILCMFLVFYILSLEVCCFGMLWILCRIWRVILWGVMWWSLIFSVILLMVWLLWLWLSLFGSFVLKCLSEFVVIIFVFGFIVYVSM